MAANQHFRSAFRGFNREDVVHYIEYLNNYYIRQLEDLNAQLQAAKAAAPAANTDLETRLQEALDRCAQLEAQLAAKEEAPAVPTATEEELEAYRRAERTERQARPGLRCAGRRNSQGRNRLRADGRHRRPDRRAAGDHQGFPGRSRGRSVRHSL